MLELVLPHKNLKVNEPHPKSIVRYSSFHIRHQQQARRKFIQIGALLVISIAIIGLGVAVTSKSSLAFINKYSPLKLSFTTPNSSALSTVPIGHDYGIAAGGSLTGLSDQDLEKAITDISALGVKWIRFDFNWNLIQPDNSKSYNWSQYDKLIRLSQSHGLHVLGILDFTPSWARSTDCSDSDKCQPANPQQFANFAAVVSHRYKAMGLHYWEIWNEPNSPQFWQPKADPVAYTQLLQKTYTSLHQEDSAAYVITAGLSPQATTSTSYTPIDFLTGIYKAGAKNYFEAVADHPYTFPASPIDKADHAWNQMVSTVSSLRQVMIANGDTDKKMWITEFGAPTNGPDAAWYVSEARQAQLVADALKLYQSYNWVGPFFWYSYKDTGTTTDTNENFFGLVRADGTKKPAYDLIQKAAQSTNR